MRVFMTPPYYGPEFSLGYSAWGQKFARESWRHLAARCQALPTFGQCAEREGREGVAVKSGRQMSWGERSLKDSNLQPSVP
jgi:hypothetical protein